MTGPMPLNDPGRPALPPLHRILTPDEFHAARQMSPEALAGEPFPVVPPLAPKDATRTGAPEPNPHAHELTGGARTASDVFQVMANHPLATAVTALTAMNPAVGWAATGLMAKDVGAYAGQKLAEASMNEQDRKAAEADPERISGGKAALNVALLAVPAGARPVFKALKNTALAAKVTEHMAGVADSWAKIFTPASRSPEATQAAGILRATTGEMAARYEQSAFKLDEFRRTIEPLPDAEKFAFIDAIEGGKAQVMPEFQAPADAIRKTLDDTRDAIRGLGTGKLEHFIQDYFPHIWKDPEQAATAFEASAQGAGTASAAGGDALKAAKIATGGTRPMEGAKSFLKARSIPTTAEGLAMGLEPVSSNPVDLTLLKLREMQRYLMAHESLNEMKDAGLVKFVSSGEQAPSGYARINDKIATVFGPREGAVTLPAGANIDPAQVGVPGMRVMGEHWAPEPVATLVNNYLSPGLRGNALFDAYRGMGNMLNQAQLGLSAFHLGFTSMDASVSRVSLGVEHLASGNVAAGLKEIASAPAAPVTNALLGRKIRAAYLNPETASPEMQALANAVKEAGGRVRMDSFYQNSAPEKMMTALRAGQYGKATALSLPALIEAPTKLLMEHIVPMQKLGVFGDLAKKVLADLPADASLVERRAALAGAWDSVDNRMGQVVYDNLFWNKTVKDLAMASVRSVGWNLGTIRELGGGMGDLAGMASGALSAGGEGAIPALTHRAAYVMALPITVGLYGAMYQMLRTGEGPTELKDYYYPKTGEVDADGNPERVQLPSYMKDMFAYAGHPWDTMKHKVAPLPNMLYEMLQNEDFYGDQIRNADDPTVKQIQQEASFLAKEVLPFSLRNAQEQAKRGDQSAGTKLGNWFGVTPAPRKDVRSQAQNDMADIFASRKITGATPEDAQARQSRNELLAAMRTGGPELDQAVTDAIERHQLTPKAVGDLLKRAGTSPAAEKFKRLTLPQALGVFKDATDEEKAKFAQALLDKVSRAKPGDAGLTVP